MALPLAVTLWMMTHFSIKATRIVLGFLAALALLWFKPVGTRCAACGSQVVHPLDSPQARNMMGNRERE